MLVGFHFGISVTVKPMTSEISFRLGAGGKM